MIIDILLLLISAGFLIQTLRDYKRISNEKMEVYRVNAETRNLLSMITLKTNEAKKLYNKSVLNLNKKGKRKWQLNIQIQQ